MTTTRIVTMASHQLVEQFVIADAESVRPIAMMIGPVTTGGKHLITFLMPKALINAASTKYSRPAKQTPITITQPDGRVLTYILKGDEVVSWCESSDGYTLLANGEGVLCYAMLDKDKNLVSSGVVACNREERNVQDLLFLKSIDKKLFYSDKQMEKFAKIRQSMFGSAE